MAHRGTPGTSCWRWKTRAEWVINRVTHRTKGAPSPKGVWAPLSPGRAEADTDPKGSRPVGVARGRIPCVSAWGGLRGAHSNQHPAGCFQGGCEDARTPPGKRGRNRVIRMGEKLTAKEEGNSGEGKREK